MEPEPLVCGRQALLLLSERRSFRCPVRRLHPFPCAHRWRPSSGLIRCLICLDTTHARDIGTGIIAHLGSRVYQTNS